MKVKKGDWVEWSNPYIKAALQIATEKYMHIPVSLRRDVEASLKGIVVGVEGEQALVLHAGRDSPDLHHQRDLRKIENENDN